MDKNESKKVKGLVGFAKSHEDIDLPPQPQPKVIRFLRVYHTFEKWDWVEMTQTYSADIMLMDHNSRMLMDMIPIRYYHIT